MIGIIILIIIVLCMSFLYTILVRYTRNVEEDDFEFDEENIEKNGEEKGITKG
jgi:hypothetical protein